MACTRGIHYTSNAVNQSHGGERYYTKVPRRNRWIACLFGHQDGWILMALFINLDIFTANGFTEGFILATSLIIFHPSTARLDI